MFYVIFCTRSWISKEGRKELTELKMKQQPKLTLVSHLIEGEKGLIE